MTTQMQSYEQKISVNYNYTVYFTNNIFDANNHTLVDTLNTLQEDRQYRVIVFIDQGLHEAQPDLSQQITTYLQQHLQKVHLVCPPQTIPGGEQAKADPANLDKVIELCSHKSYELCRHSYVVAIGGGSFLDIVGLGVSLVHRGLRLIRIPSTVLAQNDSGVGVKTGVDQGDRKNLIGTFAPPFAVINDYDLLETLPDKYWFGGIAEAVKVAMIEDATFYQFLCDHADLLGARDTKAMEQLIEQCAILHLEHIRHGGDPFELGNERPLDFGHWVAHKLEGMSGQSMGHGIAVAIGIAVDSCYAAEINLITAKERDQVLDLLQRVQLPIYSDLLEKQRDGQRVILDGLNEFREHLGGDLCLTLPRGIGEKTEINEVDFTLLDKAINFLQKQATVMS